MRSGERKLTDEQVLEEAIRKAMAGGWDYIKWKNDNFTNPAAMPEINTIIFNHDFAKALWGYDWANFREGESGDTFSLQAPNWKGHLMNMVIAVKPINYLRKNI